MGDYREILRDNLVRAMRSRGWSITTPPPVHYLAGTKKGKRVSARTIQYMVEENGPAPGLDAIAAVAVALGLQPWELLVPNLSIEDRPVLSSEGAVAAEVSRRMTARMQQLQGGLAQLMRMQDAGGVPRVFDDEGFGSQVPGAGPTGSERDESE